MRIFQDLTVWQKSHELTLKIFSASASFPKEEHFGLTSQLRRSASSVPTKIAEGGGRDGDAEMRRFLIISSGSCSEVEYQLILAKDLGYISDSIFQELVEQRIAIRKMIQSFISRLS